MKSIEARPARPGARAVWSALFALFLVLPGTAFAQFGPGLDVVPASPCTTDDVRLVFRICTCNSRIVSAARVSAVDARIDVETNPLVQCFQCAPDTIGVDFGRLPAGPGQLGGIIVHHIIAGPDSGTTRTEAYAVTFDVRNDCAPSPPPLPYLTEVLIGPPPGPCPGDSILVQLRGELPSACSQALVRVIPSPVASPLPAPERIRITYVNKSACTTCGLSFGPWSAAVKIAPLPPGDFRLPVETDMVDGCRADSVQFLAGASFPFKVLTACPPDSECFLASFLHEPANACDAVVGPDRPGDATLLLGGSQRAGGVQGNLVFDRPGLRVVGIEPGLSGTILKWEPDSTGASFVLVLPENRPRIAGPLPLLHVKIALVPGASIDHVVRLVPEHLLVSDVDGVALPRCALQVADVAARFCPEKGCDVNGDRHSDVRDLVLMVNCLRGLSNACAVPDCDENGQQNVDDVLCCARSILGGSRSDSAGSVSAPEVSVQFGAPVAIAGGIDVPVRVTAMARIGAARLVLSYPEAAFESASIELAQPASNWLVLHEGGSGALRLGAIRLAPDAQASDGPLLLTLHLASRAGQPASGDVSYVSGDFADPSGAALVTSAAPVAMPLGGGAQLALSAAHPNPFGRETRFTVALAKAGDLDVAIYDIGGRRVATLWKGPAAAGTRELVWRRTRDDGTQVPSGVYFYRATGNGMSQGGKVLILGRD